MKLSLTVLLLLPLVALASAEVDSNNKSEADAPKSGRVRRGARGLQSKGGSSSGKGGKGNSSKSSPSASKIGNSKSSKVGFGSSKSSKVGLGSSKGSKVGLPKSPKVGLPKSPKVPSAKASKAPKSSKGGMNMSPMVPVGGMNMNAMVPADDGMAGGVADPTFLIADFVSSRSDLSTLEGAFERAGLTEALAGSGPFTLFAPNDDAFALIPQVFQEILFVNDDFIPHLRDLLALHVVLRESFASDFVSGPLLAANGENQAITTSPLRVGGIPVIEPDNDVTNGVVHIINDVLTPSWAFSSISSRVDADSELSTLFTLLVLTGFNPDLASIGGVFTLLAPTNIAFEALGPDALEFLTDEANLGELQTILAYHIIQGVFVRAELQDGVRLPSVLQPLTVVVAASSTTITLNQAALGGFDILAVNGVVHKIGAVLNFADSPTQP